MALTKQILVLIFISGIVIFVTCKSAHSSPSPSQVLGSIQPEDEKAKPTEQMSNLSELPFPDMTGRVLKASDAKEGDLKDKKKDERKKDKKKGGSKDEKKGGSKDEKKGGSKDKKKGGSKDEKKGGSKDEKKGGLKDEKKDGSKDKKKDNSKDKKGDSKDGEKGTSKDKIEGDSTNEKGDVATVVTKKMQEIEKKINEFNASLKKQMDNPRSSAPGSHECVLECGEVLGAALDDIKNTLDSIANKNLVKANFDVSAVSTNVDTCNDCFDEMAGGDPEAKKLSDWVQKTTGDALEALKKAES